ncbi:hypothetical protein RHMOL_Rhmol03G0240800 [Rhododendron molle]|uniref:Uncharacterized protein n=1 Tax=Rhododendron molle TaxID=49168 RepID=A0ACC0PJ61_RHOML|nr:hypothetical protein RHMOL_Rhmol03G0240800 [Rhododendron molle]
MGDGKQGTAMVAEISPKGMMMSQHQNPNPIAHFQVKYKQLEDGFRVWLAKQSLPVEAAVVTATSAVQGAAIGAFMGTLTNDVSSSFAPPPNAALNPEAMASLKQAQALGGGPLAQARNFAVMTGVNAGISCVLKRIRGKEDVQSSMVAAFGSGAMFSLVSGMGGPNLAANAATSGVFFALVQGGIFQIGQKFSKPPADDMFYEKTRSIALRDVKIPPGPRLLILDHIQRSDPFPWSKILKGNDMAVGNFLRLTNSLQRKVVFLSGKCFYAFSCTRLDNWIIVQATLSCFSYSDVEVLVFGNLVDSLL